MSDRPRHLTHVVRRLPPKRPNDGPNIKGVLVVMLFLLAGMALAGVVFSQSGTATSADDRGALQTRAGVETLDLVPRPATATPEPLPPTSTFLAPSPTPTPLTAEAGPTLIYMSQTGDTLAAIAARFGVNPQDIKAPPSAAGETTLNPGQMLTIPRVLDTAQLGPGEKILPDSEVVFSPSAVGFDAAQFANEQGGYLARYRGYVDDVTRVGGDVVTGIGLQHSIHPRVLLAMLEHISGWVTNASPPGEALARPLGYEHPYRRELGPQLNWAAQQLEIGYYGWRAGTLTSLTFPDGSTLRLDPTLNAGTVAVHYFFAQLYNRPQWDEAVGANGFPATYRRLFGDPFARAFDLIPGNLMQPPLALPFLRGQTWYFSGGPHGAWENGGAQAALDFAPSSLEAGCADSIAWVSAVAAGQVLRSGAGVVVMDLDGDGRETTGWVIFYLHVADKDRVPAGALVEKGERIGHPSCQGGRSTGTHVHLARKYNGEWILADGAVPFNLEGWIARGGRGEYVGTLERDGVIVEACACTAAYTAVTAGR